VDLMKLLDVVDVGQFFYELGHIRKV